jgi:hypothetical protein
MGNVKVVSEYILSIITVVKSDSVGLLETMESINLLDCNNIQTIVWINSDTEEIDNHIRIAEKFANKVIVNHDDGIFDAMNKALYFSDGRFILYLNARDKIIKPFNVADINESVLIPVIYNNYFGVRKMVKVKKTVKMGIPYCHQGIIMPKDGYFYDIKYKYCADYLAILNFNFKWPLRMINNGLIEYDTTGVSSINRWESDKSTASIIYKKFGFFWGTSFIIISLFKLAIKRLYDAICLLINFIF